MELATAINSLADDQSAETVFVSALLRKRYPNLFRELATIFDPRLRLIPGTRDVWCRDYMPVRVGDNRFIQFRYEPDYLRDVPHLRTPNAFDLLKLSDVRQSGLIIDGGNIVRGSRAVALTDRIYAENRSLSPRVLVDHLREELQAERLIIIPSEPGDVFGHIDGILRLIDDRTVILNDYRNTSPEYGRQLESQLRQLGFDLIRLPYAPSNEISADGIPSASGVYVNFLETPGTIVCPTYGLAEDDRAVRALEKCYPSRRVVAVRSEGRPKTEAR